MPRSKGADKARWPGYALCLGAGILLGALCLPLLTRTDSPENRTRGPQIAPAKRTDPRKPWGAVEALKIPLAKDEQLFPDREQRLRPPAWFFESFSQPQLAEFFDSLNLGEAEKTALGGPGCLQILSNGCLVLPSARLVELLDPATRSIIYAVVARSAVNYAQRFPFRFVPDSFVSRFQGSELSPQKVELLRSLTYTNLGDLCLADLELLPALLATNEFEKVLDCLYRVPAYQIRLRVYPDSDVEALVRYWGKGGRAARIRPLLQSLAKVPGDTGAALNISYFLPPFARLRLYTFPDAWNESQASKEDCFWTSMNFFNEKPDMRYLEPAEVKKALRSDYTVVSEQPQFGDLVTLMNSAGDAIHMCVFIADDFVFTKNGKNQLAPWVLMKIPDMLLLFPSEDGHHMVIFRQKEAPGNTGASSLLKVSRNPS